MEEDGPIRGEEVQNILGEDEDKSVRKIELGPMPEEEPRNTDGDGL